jgi:hypothetical protein
VTKLHRLHSGGSFRHAGKKTDRHSQKPIDRRDRFPLTQRLSRCPLLPLYAVQVATCMSVKAQWEKLGGGMARVREYDSRKQGLEYTLKCLNVTNGGANLYEVGKFSHSADEVMLANAIWDPANLNRVSDTLVTA